MKYPSWRGELMGGPSHSAKVGRVSALSKGELDVRAQGMSGFRHI